jgi:hypothetical protein
MFTHLRLQARRLRTRRGKRDLLAIAGKELNRRRDGPALRSFREGGASSCGRPCPSLRPTQPDLYGRLLFIRKPVSSIDLSPWTGPSPGATLGTDEYGGGRDECESRYVISG